MGHLPIGGGSALVTICPILEKGKLKFAPIGLTDMFNSSGAVLNCHLSESSSLSTNGHMRSQNGSSTQSPNQSFTGKNLTVFLSLLLSVPNTF